MNNFFTTKRTDMAEEWLSSPRKRLNSFIERSDITLSRDDAIRLNKPQGKYTTLVSDVVINGSREHYARLSKAIEDALFDYLPQGKRVLAVGLGNENMTADTLGVRTVNKLTASDKLMRLTPSVYGVTGIESYDVIAGVVKQVKPDCVLVIDTLCAASRERLGCAFQLTDSGITPGSGVGNTRKTLDRTSLGVRVVSLGLPLVIYASTISGGEDELIVTPKDIDEIVEHSSDILSTAILRVSK